MCLKHTLSHQLGFVFLYIRFMLFLSFPATSPLHFLFHYQVAYQSLNFFQSILMLFSWCGSHSRGALRGEYMICLRSDKVRESPALNQDLCRFKLLVHFLQCVVTYLLYIFIGNQQMLVPSSEMREKIHFWKGKDVKFIH